MASEGVARPWYEDQPDLVKEIERDLREHYPTLRLDLSNGEAEVRGTYPILDEQGTELDRWEVSIILPHSYPDDLPIVRETGGRIPAELANHVLSTDCTACVLLPETRFQSFPRGAPFRTYLDGPVRSFFTNQSYRAGGGDWVHGEWDHGAIAAVQFYKELLGSNEDLVGWRALIAVGLGLRETDLCPCGRRRPVFQCHAVLKDVRDNIGERMAERHLVQALEERFRIRGKTSAKFLLALRGDVKGHHPCPCDSGQRVRDCHPGFRELNGALPDRLRYKRSRRRRSR